MAIKYPPLLLKYLKMFQEDPSSKIFAPLAECYRKIGMVEEAIEICKEGLLLNPTFLGGKVALARAYTDKKLYSKVREILAPIIDQIPDNLLAQKLLADAQMQLGYLKEALDHYKMILYFNPSDLDTARLVQELEVQSYKSGGLLKKKQIRPEKLKKLVRLQKLLAKLSSSTLSL